MLFRVWVGFRKHVAMGLGGSRSEEMRERAHAISGFRVSVRV
jgi:hypothetical protein